MAEKARGTMHSEDGIVYVRYILEKAVIDRINLSASQVIDSVAAMLKDQIREVYPYVRAFTVKHDDEFTDDQLEIVVSGYLPVVARN